MENTKTVTKAAVNSSGEQSLVKEQYGIVSHIEEIQKFESICPGAAREILEMAKTEQKHRIRQNYLGGLAGLLTLFTVIGFISYMIHKGYSHEALGVVITGITGLVLAVKSIDDKSIK